MRLSNPTSASEKIRRIDMRRNKPKEDGLTYETRLQNISYEDAEKIVLKKFGKVITKEGVGMMWTRRTKNVNFFKDDKIVAIYNRTVRDCWFT